MKLTAVLRPADTSKITPDLLPTVPAWWPLPGAKALEPAVEGQPPRLPAQVRAAFALTAAIEGPYDGDRLTLTGGDGQEPDGTLSMADGTIVYALDRTVSNRRVVTYRYAPHLSPGHRAMMSAVEAALEEHGQTYAMGAREDDTTARGYADAHGNGDD